MTTHFFCLGRILPLCSAELESLIQTKSYSLTDSTAWVDFEKPLDCQAYQWASGGTIKCGVELERLPLTSTSEEVSQAIAKHIIQFTVSSSAVFGIDGNNLPDAFEVHGLLTSVKKILKEFGMSSRFVEDTQSYPHLPSAKSFHEILRKQGVEIVIGFDADQVRIGRVLAVQNPDEWSHFDFGRPSRRIKEGMLPPKLARMMINIALGNTTIDQDTPLIVDPFCGSGTILSEATRIGSYCTGVDVSPDAVESAQENLIWLMKEISSSKKPYTIHPFYNYFYTKSIDKKSVRVGDSTHLHTMFSNESVDAIVTEPYMGRLISESLDFETLKNRMKGLDKLYIGFLKSAHKVLKKNGVLVFTEPFFNYSKGKMYGHIVDKLHLLGYTLVNSPIEYQREYTNVGRRVLVMKKE